MALVVAGPFADPNSPGAIQTPVSEIVKGALPATTDKVESAPKSKVAPKVKAVKKKEAAPKAEKKAAAPKKKAAPKKVKKGDYDLDVEERVAQEEAVAAEDAADAKAAKEVSFVERTHYNVMEILSLLARCPLSWCIAIKISLTLNCQFSQHHFDVWFRLPPRPRPRSVPPRVLPKKR